MTTTKKAPYAVITTLCTGQTDTTHLQSVPEAAVAYSKQITAGVRKDNFSLSSEVPAHVRLVTLVTDTSKVNSGILECGCG